MWSQVNKPYLLRGTKLTKYRANGNRNSKTRMWQIITYIVYYVFDNVKDKKQIF